MGMVSFPAGRATGVAAGAVTLLSALALVTTVTEGSSCTVQVRFAPSANGAQAATLSLPSDQAAGVATTVALSGTGAYPASIAVTPNPESFGTVSQGLTVDKTFAVYNTGNTRLNIGVASVTDSSRQFTLVADQNFCSAKTVPGGAYCLVEVAFTPTANGARAATLRILSNASNASSLAVPLSGTGAPAGTGAHGSTGTLPPISRPLVLSDVRLGAHTLCGECTPPHLTVSYRLSGLAALHATVESRASGRWRVSGLRTFGAVGGRHEFRLGSNGFSRHQLRAGRYRLVLVATNGRAHSRTVTETLRVSASN